MQLVRYGIGQSLRSRIEVNIQRVGHDRAHIRGNHRGTIRPAQFPNQPLPDPLDRFEEEIIHSLQEFKEAAQHRRRERLRVGRCRHISHPQGARIKDSNREGRGELRLRMRNPSVPECANKPMEVLEFGRNAMCCVSGVRTLESKKVGVVPFQVAPLSVGANSPRRGSGCEPRTGRT